MIFDSTKNTKKSVRKVHKTKNEKIKLKNQNSLWDEIKNQIDTINGGKPIKYKKDFMKIRFDSNDNLPLRKILSILS